MFVFRKCERQRAAPIFKLRKAGDHIGSPLQKLRAFLDAEEPQTVQWLVSFWDKQSAAVTYKELREAYLAGGITPAQLDKWQKQYANLVNTALAPQWYKAIEAAANEAKAQFPYFLYEPSIAAAQAYITERGASLVTMLAQEQKDALNAMIAQASGYTATSADELARIMRPVIGLTAPQAAANLKYYQAVRAGLINANPNMNLSAVEAKAREAAAKYAAKQHRYRAQNIARTELAMAYNAGHDGAVRDAIERGYIGDCKKTWLTADDERACPICGVIDGESVNMNDMFSIGVKTPPAHPSCRCGIAYEEISENIGNGLTNAPDNDIMELQSQNVPATPEPQPQEPAEPTRFDRYSTASEVPDEYAEALNDFTQEEKDALKYYTGHNYSKINGHLRRGDAVDNSIMQVIQEMDNAFARAAADMPSNVQLFRGAYPGNFNEWKRLEKMPLDKWAGQMLTDKGFISTSIVEGSSFGADAGEFKMTINAPKGSKGILVSPISRHKSEDEVLLNRGTQFRIDRVSKTPSGVYDIEVTVINLTK